MVSTYNWSKIHFENITQSNAAYGFVNNSSMFSVRIQGGKKLSEHLNWKQIFFLLQHTKYSRAWKMHESKSNFTSLNAIFQMCTFSDIELIYSVSICEMNIKLKTILWYTKNEYHARIARIIQLPFQNSRLETSKTILYSFWGGSENTNNHANYLCRLQDERFRDNFFLLKNHLNIEATFFMSKSWGALNNKWTICTGYSPFAT